MIYVKDLAKSFGDNHVIKNINMHITPGEKVVIDQAPPVPANAPFCAA